MSTTSSASAGIVYATLTVPRTATSSHAHARRGDAERDRDEHGHEQRHADEQQVLARPLPHALRPRLHLRRRLGSEQVAQAVARDGRLGHALEAGAGVKPDHRRLVDATAEALECLRRRAARATGGPQRTRNTASYRGKKPLVVAEDADAAGGDLGVGRVEVRHADGAGGERAQREVVVQPAHVLFAAGRTRAGRPAIHPRGPEIRFDRPTARPGCAREV